PSARRRAPGRRANGDGRSARRRHARRRAPMKRHTIMNFRTSTARRLAATASTLGALLALAACTTVGPDYRVPAQAVVNREAASAPFAGAGETPFSQNALPPHWWRLYRDATLDRLIDKAFAANTDLRVAAANLARSRAVLDEAEEEKRPTVRVNAAPA